MPKPAQLSSKTQRFSGADLRLTWPRIALLGTLGALTIALLVYWGGGRETLSVLAGVSWRWLLPALLIHYSGFAVRGRRWQQLLATSGHRLAYRHALSLLLAGWFVSALLPARAGDLLRIAVLRSGKAGAPPIPIGDSLASILLERILDIFAILVLGALFAAFALRAEAPQWVIVSYLAALALLALVALGVLIAPRLLPWMRARIRVSILQRLLGLVEESVHAMRRLFQARWTALLVTVESLYIWFCDAFLLWAVIRALGSAADFAGASFVALTVDIFAAVPLTPGGIGQVETVYGALLSLLALPPMNLAATILLVRFISYWSFVALSGVVTFATGLGALVQSGALAAGAEARPAGAE